MPHPYRYWFALHPDLRRPICRAVVTPHEASFQLGWLARQVATLEHKNSKAVRNSYSPQAMAQSVDIALRRWEQQLP